MSPRESSRQLANLERRSYRPIGKCIYCGYCGATQELSREHIVPYGLNGAATLPKASCATCRSITSAFEGEVLGGPLRDVRYMRGLRSRSKHALVPRTATLTIERNGEEESIEIGIDEFPILLHFPILAPPGYIDPVNYTRGVRLSGMATVLFGPRPEKIARNLRATRILFEPQEHKPVAFARMLAKIGYAYAYAENALDRIRTSSSVLPCILGKQDDVGYWVGTLTQEFEKHEGYLHRLALHENRDIGALVCEIQLFADSQSPSYGVILGRLN